MKYILFIIGACFLLICQGKAQSSLLSDVKHNHGKNPIDINDLGKINGVLFCSVSDDIKFSCSTVNYGDGRLMPLNVKNILTGQTIVVDKVNTAMQPAFIGNLLIFIIGKDSLCFYNLRNGSKRYIPKVASFATKKKGSNSYLIYTIDDGITNLIINDLGSGKILTLGEVGSFEIIENEKALWLYYKDKNENRAVNLFNVATKQRIKVKDVIKLIRDERNNLFVFKQETSKFTILNLLSGVPEYVDSGLDISTNSIDNRGRQFAFLSDNTSSTVWYYKVGTGKIVQLMSTGTFNAISRGKIMQLQFNQDGTAILIRSFVEPANHSFIDTLNNSKIRIWGYKDKKHPLGIVVPKYFFTALSLKTKKPVAVCDSSLNLDVPKVFNHYVLAESFHSVSSYYDSTNHPTKCLINIETGQKKLIVDNVDNISVSSEEKYVIYRNKLDMNWFSYNIATGNKVNISAAIPYPLYDDKYGVQVGRIKSELYAYGLAGWAINDKKVFFYDKYDLWEVDPKGIDLPRCVTSGIGRNAGLTLTLANMDKFDGTNNNVQTNGKLIFSAFNSITKESGFLAINAGKTLQTTAVNMAPFGMGINRGSDRMEDNHAEKPRGIIEKLGITDQFLVTRQSAEEYPNYFLTKDFKNYRRLTDFNPQKRYNWLSADLVNYKLPDGTDNQGILYKPENFDPSKKYPVIFDCYQGRSDELHLFRTPDYSNGRINIPYFVSNGYLVFVPDIYNKKGRNSENVIDVVVAATDYLLQQPFVDSNKIGIQGHSFGGWEVNILIAHTKNLFAAACAADGPTDLISYYDEISNNNPQFYYEYNGQHSPYGIGKTPWSELEMYAKDSPVLSVHNVTTPLLIVHGAKDESVPLSQGIEMYSALRRAGKKTWLLEYIDSGHGPNYDDSKDLTIRMKQFFDYYLMGHAAPKWMTNQVQPNGWQDKVGYELNPTGIEP